MLRYSFLIPKRSFFRFSSVSNFPGFISIEEQIQSLRETNIQNKDPDSFRKQTIQNEKKKLGPNFDFYKNQKLLTEIRGFKNQIGVSFTNLTNELDVNNHKFLDGFDYIVNDDLEEMILNLENIDYLNGKNPSVLSSLEFKTLDSGSNHICLHSEGMKPINYVSQLKNNEIIVTNLPLDTHKVDLYELFENYGEVISVEIYPCVLNLPAFAKIIFKKPESVLMSIQNLHWKVYKDKLLNIRTKEDSLYENSYNRTLCIMGIPETLSDVELLKVLSENGRITDFEWSKTLLDSPLPSKEELLDHLLNDPKLELKNGEKIIKRVRIINHIIGKGVEEIYEFPNVDNEANEPFDGKKHDFLNFMKLIKQKTDDKLNHLRMWTAFMPIDEYHTMEYPNNFLTEGEKNKKERDSIRFNQFFEQHKRLSRKATIKNIGENVELRTHEGKTISYEEFLKNLSERDLQYYKEVSIKKQYDHSGIAYVCYASTDEAKLSLFMINREYKTNYNDFGLYATLRQDIKDYHLDTEYIYEKLAKLKHKYKEYIQEIIDNPTIVNYEEMKPRNDREEAVKILEEIATKENIRKNLESIIDKEFLEDGENWELRGISNDKIYDAESIGRQFNISKNQNDIERLRNLLDENKSKNNIIKTSKTPLITDSTQALSDYLHPSNNEPAHQGLDNLKDLIRENIHAYHKNQLKVKDLKEQEMLLIDTFIQKINENSQFRINYEKEGLINMMGINKEEVERMYELKYINKNAIFNQPIQIAYNTQFDKIIEKNSSVDKTELIHFLRDVQILFMGVFTRDINEELFDNDNLSFTKNRIFTDLSKDITGEKYLSKQEIKRVLNLYKPLNPKEKDEIYEKEEEIVSYWENLPSHVKAELLQNESKIFPSNIIAEYDSGFPEKSFKITDPNVNFAETIEKLNKSAENGVYYTHINDKKNGDFIMRAVRPSFQLNLRKIADLDLKELKEKGIKQLGVSNEKAEQIIKELENLWKAGRFNQLNVLENIDKSQIEELLKTTKMTWEEFECLLKTNLEDPDTFRQIARQMTLERFRELDKEIHKEDLLKYRDPKRFTHSNEGKFKKSEFTEY